MIKIFTRTILILALLGLSINNAKAQYVTIPDSSFVLWLTSLYPNCMFGNQMDTTCLEIVTATDLNIDNYNFTIPDITNLSGIEYFDALQGLNCRYNSLTSLSNLPNTIIGLDCSYNMITNISNLPNSLKSIVCIGNQIASISNLPNSLEQFTCIGNLLTSLPILPNSLTNLNCNQNSLTFLPALPPLLHDLDCKNNQLTSLPTFPASLTHLGCDDNFLTSIPAVPNNFKTLTCNNNLLSSLPSFTNSLLYLNCSYNQLVSLPPISNNLYELYCDNNLLTSIPELPNGLTRLKCNNNNISCLPMLPSGLTIPFAFDISNNPINCLPNYVNAMDSTTLTIPICFSNDLINNPNGCSEIIGITGGIYKDVNSNCVLNASDGHISNTKIIIFNPLNNQFGIAYSASNGIYNFPANPGSFLVLLDTLNKPFEANCQYPGIDTTVVTTALNPLADNVNFDIKCKLGHDLVIQSVSHKNLVFPGQQHTIQAMAGDASQWYGLNCAYGTSGQVQITVTGPVTYNGVAVGALTPTINGNIYTYAIANFGTIDNDNDFQLLFTTDSTAQAGDQICVHVEITPIIGDINPSNNIKDFCYSVVNSYDPNYKEVYPTDVPPLFQDWLTYTIHFQNLGTAPAINIRLLDTLDNNLDVETFEVINYRHYNTVTMMDGILDFRFPNILLPDSASNPSGSQGFVQYRIKPKANLIAGTQIENTAHIYFDFNPAVVTNTTVNNFVTTVGNATLKQTATMKIYPNPSTGIFTISSTANIEVYNLIGDLILSENNVTSIDLTAAPKGMYFVKLNGDKIEKLIKN